MNPEIERKYLEKDNLYDKSGFRSKARLHQSWFRTEVLRLLNFDIIGNYLSKEDALKGYNFYDGFGILDAVNSRYYKYGKQLRANMLRSEHIPFNFFIPINYDKIFGKNLLNEFLNGCIEKIDVIKIEYAPSPARNYLDDRTSFDVYIEYSHKDNDTKGILGIELKYTEHAYPLKKYSPEYYKIMDLDSSYYIVSKQSGLYKGDALSILKKDRYRQIWRNHLLGESILQFDKRFKYFTSITIFPKGNTHFVDASIEYQYFLKENNNNFVAITFEDFINTGRKYSNAQDLNRWLNYLENRYIIV